MIRFLVALAAFVALSHAPACDAGCDVHVSPQGVSR